MTLEDALAVWLYFLDEDTIGESEERILDTAWETIALRAKVAIRSFPESSSGRQSPGDKPVID